MARRVRLCPEITDPELRGFLDLLPDIRRFNDEITDGQPLKGKRLMIPLGNHEIEVFWHPAAGGVKRPVLFEFHGGGFMLGNAKKCDALCRKISRNLDCHVIGVNYRLAPENSYPAAVEDAYNVIKYFAEHADEYSFDEKKIAVIGYSAGANLAAVTALKACKSGEFEVCAQVLHYPYLDAIRLPEEKKSYPCDMDPAVMKAFTLLYSKEEERRETYVSPVCASAEELKGLPPACIIPAQRDSLCEEGVRYAEMLKEAGVEVYCRVMPDVHHGYVEDAANEYVYQKTMEDTRKTHDRYFREWAGAAIGITNAFLMEKFQ